MSLVYGTKSPTPLSLQPVRAGPREMQKSSYFDVFPFKPGRLSTRGYLIALLRARRYIGIILGFRSQGVEQFVRSVVF